MYIATPHIHSERQNQFIGTVFHHNNSGFLYSTQHRHQVMLMMLQHYYRSNTIKQNTQLDLGGFRLLLLLLYGNETKESLRFELSNCM